MRSIRMFAPVAALVALLVLSFSVLSAEPAAKNGVLRATLGNGLRVVIVENGLAPVVTTQVNYLVGSNEAPDGFPGTAHALEHMMFRGSPGLSAAQLSRIMALMGGEFNADTQQTVTQYYLTVPREDLDVALRFEAVRMSGVLATEDLWREERGAIEQEVAHDLSNPQYLFSMQLLERLFAGTPYAHDALGTRPSFDKTTGAMLRQFHDTWYAPNNAILVIVGDVDPKKTLDMVRKAFAAIPRRTVPLRPVVELGPVRPGRIALDTDAPAGTAIVAYRLPGFDSPDFAAGQILADALDNRRSELSALVPRGKALFTGFGGGALPKGGYGYAIAGFPQGANGDALASEVKAIIDRYVKDGVPPDLVEASKRHEIADAAFQKNSISGLAAAWSQALAVEGRSSPDDDIDAVRKVTVADVNRVARQYLLNEAAITAVLTPRPTGQPGAPKGFGGGESFAPSRTTAVELPLWAKKAERLPALSASRVHPAVTDLPNGIRLIVQSQSISPAVTVVGRIRSNPDLQTPPGKEGVAELLDSLFSYGTTSLDRIAFQKAQDDIAADISGGTNFSLGVLEDHFDRGMELLAADLLQPALPEPAFAVMREELAESLAGLLRSPGYLSQRALRSGLYPANDPELRQTTPGTVAAVTLDDAKAYYRKVFRPDMTTIVVAGNVTPDQARRTVEKYFGKWRAEGPKPDTDYPAVPLNKPGRTTVTDASRVQTEVTLAETVGITRSHPDYYRLELGNRVLSGAFYASRLYRDLREKAGLVYSVDSFVQAGRTRTVFGVAFACDPHNVSRSRTMVEHDLREMQKDLLSPSELHQTKTLLLRQLPLSEASVDAVAGGLLSRSIDGLPLDEPVYAARRYLDMTAEEVRDAFTRLIRPSDFVEVIVAPETGKD
jgi:zinc protease